MFTLCQRDIRHITQALQKDLQLLLNNFCMGEHLLKFKAIPLQVWRGP
jgi:hypothetical protein